MPVTWEPNCSWSSSSTLDLLNILEKNIFFFVGSSGAWSSPRVTHLTVLQSSPFLHLWTHCPQPELQIRMPWEAVKNSKAQATSQANYIKQSLWVEWRHQCFLRLPSNSTCSQGEKSHPDHCSHAQSCSPLISNPTEVRSGVSEVTHMFLFSPSLAVLKYLHNGYRKIFKCFNVTIKPC